MFNFLTSTHAHGVWDIGIWSSITMPIYIIFTKHVVKKSKRTCGIGDLVEKSDTTKVIS